MILDIDNDRQAMKSALQNWISSARAEATDFELADLYHTSIFANASARYWANKLQSVPFQLVTSDGDIVESVPSDHPAFPILEILNSPSFPDYLMKTETTLRFWGYSMAVKNRNIHKRPRNLQWVNPFLYSQQGNAIEGLRGFQVYSGRYQNVEAGFYPLSDTIYMKEGLNFDDDSKGTSSAEVAFLQASASVEIAMAQYASFKNFAIPATVFQPEAPSAGAQFTTAPRAEDRDDILNYMKRLFRGARNAGKTMVSSVRWQIIQLSPVWKDSLPVEQDKNLREAVATAFDLPIEFLTTGQTTYAELDGKMFLWTEDRFIPRCQWYASQLTEQLCKTEGLHDFYIQPDLTDIMKSLEGKRVDNIDKKLKSGYISLTQAQEELNLKVNDLFKGLYYVEGVGFVPEAEVPNVWKYKLNIEPEALQEAPQALSSVLSAEAPMNTLQAPQKLSDFKTESLDYIDNTIDPFYSEAEDPEAVKALTQGLKASELSEEEQRLIEFSRLKAEVPVSVFNEINIATRKGLKGKSFTPDALNYETSAYIAHLVGEGCQQEDIIHYALKHYVSVKARAYVAPIRAYFERQVDSIFRNAIQGKYSKRGFIGALTPVIQSAIRDASEAGLKDGGLKKAEMTEEESAWVQEWILKQNDFIEAVATAIYEDGKVTAKEAEGKAVLWWNKSIDPAYSEMVFSASKNGAFLRKLGATEQHCVDCVKIDGQVRRASFWHNIGIWNASPKTQCGGWRCQCQNVATDKPITRGRFPQLVGHK